MEFTDIRQSNQWSEYLELYGLKSFNISNGVIVRVLPVGPFSIMRVQRPKSLSDNNIKEIKDIAKANKCALIKVEPYLNQNMSILEKNNFVYIKSPSISPKTIWIDLTKSESSLWDALSDSAKYSIHRASREGTKIVIDKFPTNEVLNETYNILKDRANKKGFFIQGIEDLKKKVQVFKDNSYAVRAYNNKGDLLSTKYYFGFDGCVWYMHGGTSDRGQKTKAGYALCWESIKFFKSEGYKTLDWDGIYDERYPELTSKWKNLTDFKMKFGGFIVEMPPTMGLYLSPLLKAMHTVGLDV